VVWNALINRRPRVPEKALVQDILDYLDQFPLTFGWYTTGVTLYDDTGLNRVRGRDSDFFCFTSEVHISSSNLSYRSKKDIYTVKKFK
jgi:hypothetical protein